MSDADTITTYAGSATEVKLGTPSAKLGPAPGYIPPPPPWIAEAAAARALSASGADISTTAAAGQGAKGADAPAAPRVTVEQIESEIENELYFNAYQGASMATSGPVPGELARVTICVLVLRNGTLMVGVNEGPVSPENFDAALGREYARKDAIEQIWPVLGYELRTKLAAEAATKAAATN